MFLEEKYVPQLKGDETYLARSFELHFNERPFLHHTCYLFITKTTKESSRMQSNFSILCRGRLIPHEITDPNVVQGFLESVDQFQQIVNDSGQVRLERLSTDDIVGTSEKAGLLERYFALFDKDAEHVARHTNECRGSCVSATRFFVCILFPMLMICPEKLPPIVDTDVIRQREVSVG